MRNVCLPLEKLDQCTTCDEKSNLQLCSKCGEAVYCSPKCQKKDWPRHKFICNGVDRVDLPVLYPFLASLAEIVNPESLPPNLSGVPIILGEQIPEDEFTLAKWCPGLRTDSARRKLFQRILHENYALPILMSISIALLAGIYTTKTVRNVRRGVRLVYRGSTISDFGIAKGSLNVQDKNKLVYGKETAMHYISSRGQDPDEHYWLYFKTIKNEEAIVDLATSTFNLGSQVKVDPYIPGVFPVNSFAPALFQEQNVAETRNDIGAHREQARFSVLRNNDLHALASYATGYRVTWVESDDMWDFMDTVAGRRCNGIEKIIATDLLQCSLARFESVVEGRAWQQWPTRPECRPCSDDAESDPISAISRLDDMVIISHILQNLEIPTA